MPRYNREGTRNRTKYSLVNTLNARIVGRMRQPIRNNANTRRERPLAFAVLRSFTTDEADGLQESLGKAINFEAQPEEFKQKFAADGSVLPSERSKFVFLSFVDRYRKSFMTNRLEGTNVPNQNIPAIFENPPANLSRRTNNVLTQFVERTRQDPNSNRPAPPPSIALAKGGATTLLQYLLSPESPLLADGFEYIVLVAASQELAQNYYSRLFGFTSLHGVPTIDMPVGEVFDSFEDAPVPAGLDSWDVKKMQRSAYLRRIGETEFLISENDFAGPIMYKKLAVAPAPAPVAAAPVPVAPAASQGLFGRFLSKYVLRGIGGRRQTQKRRVR
jgi:hypothetical protein